MNSTTTDRPLSYEIGEIFLPIDKPVSYEALKAKFTKLQNGSMSSKEDLSSLNFLSREVSDLTNRSINDLTIDLDKRNEVSAALLELAEKIEKTTETVKVNIAFVEFEKSYTALNNRFESLIFEKEDQQKLQDLMILADNAAEATESFQLNIPDSKEKKALLNNSFAPLCEKIANLIETTIPFVKSTASQTQNGYNNHGPQNFTKQTSSFSQKGYFSKQSTMNSINSLNSKFKVTSNNTTNSISKVNASPESVSSGITEVRQSFAMAFIKKINSIDRNTNKIFAVLATEGKFEVVRFAYFDNEANPETLSYYPENSKKSHKVNVSDLRGIEFSHTERK